MATIFGQKNHWWKLGMMMTFMEVKANRGQIQWIIFVLPLWYLVSRWGLGSKVCMHHFGCGNGMNWIKGYCMIVKVKIETFWFSTYSMEMHSLTSSSFIICLRGETFGSRTILLKVALIIRAYSVLSDMCFLFVCFVFCFVLLLFFLGGGVEGRCQYSNQAYLSGKKSSSLWSRIKQRINHKWKEG